jgi:putative transcriptional regulator
VKHEFGNVLIFTTRTKHLHKHKCFCFTALSRGIYFYKPMQLLGRTLLATADLAGDYFENSEILIVGQDANGTTGVITNRAYHRTLNQLTEFEHCKPVRIMEGGPVQQDMLFFTHSSKRADIGGAEVNEEFSWAGNFKVAVELLNAGSIKMEELQLYIGYCGWDAGQLEEEIKEGCWEVF